jgi:hypothetical protein
MGDGVGMVAPARILAEVLSQEVLVNQRKAKNNDHVPMARRDKLDQEPGHESTASRIWRRDLSRFPRKRQTRYTGDAVSDPGTPLKDAAALLWAEAQRQMTRQESDLDNLRNRAVALLSVASIVAALFGSHIATTHPSATTKIASGVALVAFALSALLTLLILVPKKGWVFTENLEDYLQDLSRETLKPVDVTGNLAAHFEEYRLKNATKIDGLYKYLNGACLLIGVQVVAWGFAALR